MYIYELSDIMFFLSNLSKHQTVASFDISQYVSFYSNTRSSSNKLYHKCTLANSYFFRLPKLWNTLPIIDLSLSLNTIKSKLILFL